MKPFRLLTLHWAMRLKLIESKSSQIFCLIQEIELNRRNETINNEIVDLSGEVQRANGKNVKVNSNRQKLI